MNNTGLLLIAHGSRNPDANADLVHAVDGLRRRGHAVVEPAYLELAPPTIDEAAETCLRQGADVVVLLPYFLSAGVHVRRDLAEARNRLAERHPAIRFLLGEPLGLHPLLLDVVEQRLGEALLTSQPLPK